MKNSEEESDGTIWKRRTKISKERNDPTQAWDVAVGESGERRPRYKPKASYCDRAVGSTEKGRKSTKEAFELNTSLPF